MQTRKIVLNLEDGASYSVRLGAGILQKLGAHLLELEGFEQGKRLLLLSDETVASLYGAEVKRVLSEAGFRVRSISVPAGEDAKKPQVLFELWEALAQLGFDRDCAVLALGGGVVGDLAGFLASTYMRGLPLIQLPTTLLAMADSSVGGKTGLNLGSGKNLVGTFKQPAYVCADMAVLSTLEQREWTCGCAEIVKMSLLSMDDFFFWLQENVQGLAQRDEAVTAEALQRALVLKADVIAGDVHDDKGIRECLNFGHTFGHALEAALGWGAATHGACVAEGMRFAVRLGAQMLGTPLELVHELDNLLDELGLPALSEGKDALSAQDLLSRMKKDKKSHGGILHFILLDENAHWAAVDVPDETVLEHLQAWCAC